MHRKFHEKFGELLSRGVPFVVATVIEVRGSAVAKPGAKAIIDAEGRPVFGWVGGGCVEAFVCAEAREALTASAPRIITADLEDELSGIGLPCGGVMQIFIEPVQPPRRVIVRGESETAHEASRILERTGFAVTRQASTPENEVALLSEGNAQAFKSHGGLDIGGDSAAERALSLVAEMIAALRGASCRPLQEVRTEFQVEAFKAARVETQHPSLVIIGHSNITEELAWFGSRLGWRVYVDSTGATEESYPAEVIIIRGDSDFTRMPASSGSAVIVATHHKGDHLAIGRALEAGAWYVGLVASAHRSKLVRAMLEERPHADMRRLRTPCGLDLGATTPAEIALSIMSEVLACFHGRTGEPRSALTEAE